MKRIIITIVCLFSLLVGTIGVYAQEEAKVTKRSSVIESICARDASQELIDYLNASGVQVSQEAIIETVRLRNTDKQDDVVYAISVVSMDDNITNRRTVLLIDKRTGNPVSSEISMIRGSFSDTHKDDYVKVTFTASYTTRYNSTYTDYAYRPLSVSFYYYLVGSASSSYLNVMTVNYICNGEVYSYPGFVDQGYCDSYSIPRTVYYPSPGVTYSNSSPYSSSLCLYDTYGILPNGTMSGNYVIISYTYAGNSYSYTYAE